MPTRQYGTQRLNEDQQRYWAAQQVNFTDILTYRPLTQDQESMLKTVYYTENNLVGARKLYTAVWPRLANPPTQRQVQAWLSTQQIAQRNKPAPRAKSHNPIMVRRPLERLQIDCMNMGIRNQNNGRRFILNAIDIFTKKAWARVIHTPNYGLQKTAPTAAKALAAFSSILEEINRVHGQYPERYQSDNGSEFMGVFKEAFQPGGRYENIKTNYSIAYRATSQSIVERFNGTMRSQLAKYIQADETQRDENPIGPRMLPWPDIIPGIITNYNGNKHTTLKRSPNSMFTATRAQLKEIKDDINAKHRQQNHNLNLIAIGTRVRLKDFKVSKSSMNKDEPHWGSVIYTVVAQRMNRRTDITEYQIQDASGRDPPTTLRGPSGAGRTGYLGARRRFTRYELLPIDSVNAPAFALQGGRGQAAQMPLHVLQAQGQTTAPTAASASRFLRNHKNPASLVNKNVNIKWDASGPLSLEALEERGNLGTYYKGKVISYNAATGLHKVKYVADNEEHEHNLMRFNKADYQPWNPL